jgi:hypothetical protein
VCNIVGFSSIIGLRSRSSSANLFFFGLEISTLALLPQKQTPQKQTF